MTDLIHTETELEERLSRPSAADMAAMAALDGDLIILGAGGKMGPSLARLARRATDQAGVARRIVAVARFTNRDLIVQLESHGIEAISADLLEPQSLSRLPDIPNVIFMAARKFGTTGSEYLTWAMNTYLPGLVAQRYRDSRIVAFSTGNIYPLRRTSLGGAIETDPCAPAGEYAASALGRERMFEYASENWKTKVAILRLNYAIDLRYGVLSDIGRAVFERRPVDLRMGLVNVIWQGDANGVCLRSLGYCETPPNIFNLSGPETLSIRYLAHEFGRRFGIAPILAGEEAETALLTNAAKCHQFFGYPQVAVRDLIDWTAHWIASGGGTLNKPTHFETRDGKF